MPIKKYTCRLREFVEAGLPFKTWSKPRTKLHIEAAIPKQFATIRIEFPIQLFAEAT